MEQRHVLLVTFPAQGHINPSLQFAKRLLTMGIQVTFATSEYARRRMEKSSAAAALPKGLTFAAFSDGYDDGFKLGDDAQKYMSEIRAKGYNSLKQTILAAAAHGRPVTTLVYTLLLPWASQAARELHVPAALLWIQPATVLTLYYHYFHGFEDQITAAEHQNDDAWEIQFPGIEVAFSKRDLPSFMLSSSSDIYSFALPTFKEQLEMLDAEPTKPRVLVNTFDALEPDALRAVDKYELIGVGPLIPSSDSSSGGGDLFQKSDDDYIAWLSTKPEASVVYVSFGSLLRLPMLQMEEIAKGLIDAGRPFLWVIRAKDCSEEEEEKLSCLEELEKIGKIVTWCSQVEVLRHPSVGCFVSHCGWNSTLESLSCGVPVVAFPQWTDQGTNAKLIEDVWGMGVRVRVSSGGEGGIDIVESGEIRRCVEEVMDGGERSRVVKGNAEKWRDLAREAMSEGGSSYNNLKGFLEVEMDG